MRNEILEQTGVFVRQELTKLAGYPNKTLRMAEYRIEHSFRVAHIAAEIARKEGLDEERACVAGLLHDIGYSVEFTQKGDSKRHGIIGAEIARPFLLSLGYPDAQADEMCYGIAIHVSGIDPGGGDKTPLALTVGDADDIDRYDAYRLYEGLQKLNYMNLPIEEQHSAVEMRMERLGRLRHPLGTATATGMWYEKLDFQTEFYAKLLRQIEHSR